MSNRRESIETVNKYMVAARMRDDYIHIAFPPLGPISPDDALLFAAYLVTMAEHNASHTFQEVLDAVQST